MTTDLRSEIPDQPSTIVDGGGRKWIYPVEISGKWQRLRFVTSAVLLCLLYATPWLKIGGAPFLKLSFLAPSFYLFGSPILIYEFYHFALLALLLVTTLFAASALIGRAWCGYACPQTIFIEQILGRVDRLFEGPAAKRLADSKRPLTFQRLLRKVGKQFAYGLISFSFSFTLVALFTGPELIISGNSHAASLALVFLTVLAWFDAAYWREQFCHIACPYARFQGVMQDMATRTIGYDLHRGEPRGRERAVKEDGPQMRTKGDCIDCGLCVRVCPSGIDIRQGATQQECVACARCIDACDGVMTNIGRPTGLIRYDAIATFEADREAVVPRPKVFRPRIAVYAAVWALLLIVGIHQFIHRLPFHAKIFGTPGAMPWFIEGDRVKNLLSLKIGNQSLATEFYEIMIEGDDSPAGIRIETPAVIGPIPSGQEVTMPLLISSPQSPGGNPAVRVTVRSRASGVQSTIERRLVGPRS